MNDFLVTDNLGLSLCDCVNLTLVNNWYNMNNVVD